MAVSPEEIYDCDMKASSKQLVLYLLLAAAFALAATGCQTTKGFGKDVEHLGDKIQDKAN